MAYDTETIQTISCDRCNKSVRSIQRQKILPDEWGRLGNLDLCPNCAPAFREWMGWDPDDPANGQTDDPTTDGFSILRAWDAWLLTGQEDSELLAETADRTAAFFGADRGAQVD